MVDYNMQKSGGGPVDHSIFETHGHIYEKYYFRLFDISEEEPKLLDDCLFAVNFMDGGSPSESMSLTRAKRMASRRATENFKYAKWQMPSGRVWVKEINGQRLVLQKGFITEDPHEIQ